jgi:DNA uptake protein ComE-like DNA-binding protein
MPASHLRSLARALAVSCLAAATVAFAAVPTAAREAGEDAVGVGALPRQMANVSASDVIVQWNSIAVRTIVAEGLTPVPAQPLYHSFTSVAMYDAVVSIRGGFESYALRTRPAGARGASVEAAVAAAAYTLLRHYFPSSAVNLDRDLATSLAQVPDGRAKDLGVRIGQAAAQAIIDLRADDGRGASVTLNPPAEPGVWRPTPPAMAPMLVPWLGFVRPMVLRSPTQIRLPGPDALTSAAYTRDFREVRDMGAVDSVVRTPEQTETALFWNDNAVTQHQAAMRNVVAERRLNAVRTARMFALVNTGTADALIACWRVKYDDPYWRPITAIRLADTDGNPATAADPTWTPLATTPPYPEYPSGHACFTGAVARSLSHLFGSRHIDLDVSSAVTGTSRHFDTASQLNRQTMDARIWLGFHFRAAMTDGNRLGQETAAYVANHEFGRPGH